MIRLLIGLKPQRHDITPSTNWFGSIPPCRVLPFQLVVGVIACLWGLRQGQIHWTQAALRLQRLWEPCDFVAWLVLHELDAKETADPDRSFPVRGGHRINRWSLRWVASTSRSGFTTRLRHVAYSCQPLNLDSSLEVSRFRPLRAGNPENWRWKPLPWCQFCYEDS